MIVYKVWARYSGTDAEGLPLYVYREPEYYAIPANLTPENLITIEAEKNGQSHRLQFVYLDWQTGFELPFSQIDVSSVLAWLSIHEYSKGWLVSW